MQSLPRTVIVLGFVSLLNDAASEMITPLLPIFLTATLGAGPAIVGLIEGVAEATASILKLVSGWLADRGWAAKKLVLGGYSLSNVTRPLIGLALAWPLVIALRFLDRVGKGIRTAPRDAMIAGVSTSANRGRAYGFHRSMDHAGAVIGPLLAFALLQSGVDLRHVFYASMVPGIAVLLLIAVGVPSQVLAPVSYTASLSWRALDTHVRAMVLTAGALALAAVPEVFVVLWARDAGLAIVWVPLIWAAASAVKMSTAWPAGILADRYGRMPVFAVGITLRVVSLLLLAFVAAQGAWVWLLFLLYSLSLAITEPVERSLIGDHATATQRGTAFGFYHLLSGALLLPGAVAFGWLWERFNSMLAFASAAAVTALGAAVFILLTRPRTR
ncbi:MAG: MFS transporter [Steroidobacteraceae bacterium]